MTPNLPLKASAALLPTDPQSNVRARAHARSPSPPRPELPDKWRDKRQQVWSVARLRPEFSQVHLAPTSDLGTEAESVGVTEPWTTSVLPTERSEGNAMWAALADARQTRYDARALKSSPMLEVLARPLEVRLVRVLLGRGIQVSRAAGALLVPVGMFVAGVVLIAASGLQLFVILPALLLRRSLVQFARFTIRQSAVLQKRTPSTIGELADARL